MLKRLSGQVAASGLTLHSDCWNGTDSRYLVSCTNGHQFARRAALLLRGAAKCLQCGQDEARQRFFDTLHERGFFCGEKTFRGTNEAHRLICRSGHEWSAVASKVVLGSGCPVCASGQHAQRSLLPDGLERLRAAAAEQGGRCLSDRYMGVRVRYRWECARGHRWEATGQVVSAGHWCRQCAGMLAAQMYRIPDGFARLQAAAASRGGECLEAEYLGSRVRHRFCCAEGHEWQVEASRVLRGTWCRQCASRRHSELMRSPDGLERLRAAAAAHGGTLVEALYMGSAAKYTFRCAHGHEWQDRGAHVLEGRWCRECGRSRKKRLMIAKMQALANERGGRCLSADYRGSRGKLTWECHLGHVWTSAPATLLYQGAWCPNCARLRITKNPRLRRRYDVAG